MYQRKVSSVTVQCYLRWDSLTWSPPRDSQDRRRLKSSTLPPVLEQGTRICVVLKFKLQLCDDNHQISFWGITLLVLRILEENLHQFFSKKRRPSSCYQTASVLTGKGRISFCYVDRCSASLSADEGSAESGAWLYTGLAPFWPQSRSPTRGAQRSARLRARTQLLMQR